MKILAIRGKNLASLENEFEIDFTSEPLHSAGIFAITGSTGAGKSTILDALCLALFDDAPRLKDAEASIAINDVDDKPIKQRDSRNILRRGASDGYAEVDFIAPNGDKYRSRWAVRRAQNKINGALQYSSIKLQNLTTGIEEQGTKTDILNRIKEIIGLSFEQFTRAVLLAQGEFANFLKAKQNEKAELLEKLSGTEIYSQISALIYQKTGEAKSNLELLQHQISDIKLLSDEEIEAYTSEKTKLEQEIEPLKKLQIDIEKKQNWIKQEEQLNQDIETANNNLKTVQAKIEQAGSRYEYILMIDTAQQIRDTYLAWNDKQKQSRGFIAKLSDKKSEKGKISNLLESAEKELLNAKAKCNENEHNYTLLKPDIAKAKELDIKIQSAKETVNETKKEFDYQTGLKTKSESDIENINARIKKVKSESETYTKWFTDKEVYKPVIQRAELLVNLLDDAQAAKSQSIIVAANFKLNNEQLDIYKEQLKHQQQKTEELNKLLPTEVLNLRAKLKDGKACPVCGSTHHPLDSTQQDINVDEKKLERAKEDNAKQIADLSQKIESTQKEIARLDTLVNTYHAQYDAAIFKAKDSFKNIQGWEEKLETGVLQKRITEFAKKWNEYDESLNANQKSIEGLSAKLESESNSLKNIIAEYSRKNELLNKQNASFSELVNQRKPLLKGKNVNEIESVYNKLKKEYDEAFELKEKEKRKLDSQSAEINGTIQQIEQDADTISAQVTQLNAEINNWINQGNHAITFDLLTDLMSKSRDWISSEKEYLSDLKNQQLVLDTTLKEKQNRWDEHCKLPDKPLDEESKELLATQLSETGERTNDINKQLNQFEVLLAKNKDSEKQIKTFEKELIAKNQLHENWAKLNYLLGSADGKKFKRIAQSYTLDVLLSYANKHLENLSRRYKLEKIPDTLALQVIDNDMLGEVRTVHSLSGGESFLISLSLALGLSSLSSSRMNIESLFIDEGFGSLDIDTLNVAMDALENLQTQGRKIGVISHVEEMKERIPTQIQVIKSSNGKSSIKIIG